MELTTPYAFGKVVDIPYAAVVEKVRAALAAEGFGILTEIDPKAKFREKLQKEFRDYIILGACNPAMAYEAFAREITIGALLPCNVIVYTTDAGQTAVLVMDPVAVLSLIDNPEMTELAQQVRERMERVLAAL